MSDLLAPYLSKDLFLPRDFDSHFSSLVSQGRGSNSPFPRKADLWWAGMVIGVNLDIQVPPPSSPSSLVKFNNCSVFGRESWRIVHLELIAISTGDLDEAPSPSQVIEIAHEFVFGGLNWFRDYLLPLPENPTIAVMELLSRKFEEVSRGE